MYETTKAETLEATFIFKAIECIECRIYERLFKLFGRYRLVVPGVKNVYAL